MSSRSLTVRVTHVVEGLVRELRPHQWYKQGVLLLGIVFSRSALDPVAWANVLAAMAAFTAVAGATYVLNDVSDVEADREHPEKRHRPIASGQVPIPVAVPFAAGLLAAGLAAGYLVDPLVAATLLVYVGQNAVYSLLLKEVVLVDVLVIAVGFVLRAVAGVLAIGVYLSPWLIVCTFLLALVLAVGKRRDELASTPAPAESRRTLGAYTAEGLDGMLVMTTSALLMAYALYTFFRAEPAMMLTFPFAVFGVLRFHHLVHRADATGRPEYLLTDRPMVVNLLLWAAVAVGVLYRVHRHVLEVLP